MYQKGGLEPLIKVPTNKDFKYTLNENRKLWIRAIYPYIDIFLQCIREIPFQSYSYDGIAYVKNIETNEIESHKCNTQTLPIYFFSGGTVYEILNNKYQNIDLYSFCDPTGDIDVALYPPKITDYNDGYTVFLNEENIMSPFYRDFIEWTFDKITENISRNSNNLDEMFPTAVPFDIEEYNEIEDKYKTAELGYKTAKVGNLYVVAFLNESREMFKIQIVCKITENTVSVIDHIMEIIIPLPENDNFNTPAADGYKINYDIIEFSKNNKYNIQPLQNLISDNINAYIKRKQSYQYDEHIHKVINHIARLFYLYELFYKNEEVFQINKLNLLFINKENENEIMPEFLYYNIVGGNFNKISVSVKNFLSAYYSIIIKTHNIKQFNIKNKDFFEKQLLEININNLNSPENSLILKNKHDSFINEIGYTQHSKNSTRRRYSKSLSNSRTISNSSKKSKSKERGGKSRKNKRRSYRNHLG